MDNIRQNEHGQKYCKYAILNMLGCLWAAFLFRLGITHSIGCPASIPCVPSRGIFQNPFQISSTIIFGRFIHHTSFTIILSVWKAAEPWTVTFLCIDLLFLSLLSKMRESSTAGSQWSFHVYTRRKYVLSPLIILTEWKNRVTLLQFCHDRWDCCAGNRRHDPHLIYVLHPS